MENENPLKNRKFLTSLATYSERSPKFLVDLELLDSKNDHCSQTTVQLLDL